jgi:hypothetical protein
MRIARSQFEARVKDALQQPDKGVLQLEIFLEKTGARPLDTLTLRVDQIDAADGVVRADLVSVDVSGVGVKEAKEIHVEVPWGGAAVVQVAPVVEPAPQMDLISEYPEFAGLRPPAE